TRADGMYSISAPSGSEVRVEFTGLPDGYVYGPQGASAGTAVQFAQVVTAGYALDVNLALVRPQDYSPDDPLLLTSRYVYGGSDQANADSPALVGFDYTAGAAWDDPTLSNHFRPAAHAVLIPQRAVGATWGIGYSRPLNRGFAAAFT